MKRSQLLLAAACALLLAGNAPVDPQPTDGGSDPLVNDADGDQVPDGVERWLGTDEHDVDTDKDGMHDGVEVLLAHTDPLDPDTDGDKWCDGSLTVEGQCVGGEDLNDNGSRDDAEETNPSCQGLEPYDPSTARGSNVFGCSAGQGYGSLGALAVLSALRRRRPRRP